MSLSNSLPIMSDSHNGHVVGIRNDNAKLLAFYQTGSVPKKVEDCIDGAFMSTGPANQVMIIESSTD